MATLFEINQGLMDLVDMETGEIKDLDAWDALKMDRQEKLENIALLAKNSAADIKILKDEEDSFKRRRKAAEKTLAWCKETLLRELKGEKLMDERRRFSVFYRQTERVKVNDFSLVPKEFIKEIPEYMKESLVDKQGIKTAIEAGRMVPGAEIETAPSIQIR